jgi:hypothetical protein
MLTKESVEQFCFDVLGDFIYPELDCIIDPNRVIVTRLRGVPAEVLRDTWNRNAEGTEFENVSLYL